MIDATNSATPADRSDAEERAYLHKRAQDHRRLADRTDEAGARAIHLKLMRLYETRASLLELVQTD